MKRRAIEPRPDWRARVEALGMVFHTTDDLGVYWGEGTYYEFTAGEIDAIERATAELHRMCVETAGAIIEQRRLPELGLDPLSIELVERSWREQPPSLYGRFDLAMGDGVPKMLEYNADTPTSLLEGGVIQWAWLGETLGAQRADVDQFTIIHDRLIATWRELAPRLGERVHFAWVTDLEDEMTVGYLRDTAQQAGLATVGLPMHDIGFDPKRDVLVDLAGEPITSLFKLYPWEGLVLDPLAKLLPRVSVNWIEPAWKMVLSNKFILPILWERYPGHPNLLAASREEGRVGPSYVKKPVLGREGANVTVVANGVESTTAGPYAKYGYVYQAYAELGEHDGMRPVVGSWVIGGVPSGVGIRETPGYVTSNTARYVPHAIIG